MKTTSALVLAAAAFAATSANAQDGAFTTAEKALWIDRHNYFRMTALPFSAGNMLKIKWSDALATAATADAAGCTAVTGAGINAHTHSSSTATSIVDAAFKEWAVTAGLSALSKIKAPKTGEAVGTGVYNSYSQIVWSATNQVGCGFATCPAGKLVVCKYAAPGNSASEPWYIHAPPNSQCPGGTEGKLGLCIVPGDAASNDLAPIPAGQNAYDVFASFIGSMQKVLKGESVDGGPATGTGANTNPGAPAAAGVTTAPATNGGAAAAASTPAPAATTPAATATTAPGVAAAITTAPGTEAATATTATMAAGSSATDTAVGATTKAPHSSAGSNASAGMTAGSTASSSDGSTKKSIGFGSITSDSGASPGTVRAGSSTGTTFTNGGVGKHGAKSQSTDETKSTGGGSGNANNKSGDESSGGLKFSAAGVAGAVVVGCVMIAGVFVFVSYRKNQRRQRDIMQNGGIHIL